jgi:hypothetical protein
VGRSSLGQCMIYSIMGMTSVRMVIGMYPLFCRFILSFDISSNTCSKVCIIFTLIACPGVMMIISFANYSMVVCKVGRSTNKYDVS